MSFQSSLAMTRLSEVVDICTTNPRKQQFRFIICPPRLPPMQSWRPKMTTELVLKSDSRLEFAFGKVSPGKEAWMFAEYFPAMGPAMAEYELSQLASFAVIATNVAGVTPVMGSFVSWPSAEKREAFHNDPRFVKIRPERDGALDLLSDGHLFQSMDEVIALNTDSDYAVIIAKDAGTVSDPIFALPLTSDSPEQAYTGKSISLRPWSEAEEQLLNSSPTEAEVFRVRFNPAG
ncbi:MAG: hypothetical protein GY798_24710 [Hyphomicrobiales bacterium]|nr:hypothetical protein [Hyphomicrobiales bacterium]